MLRASHIRPSLPDHMGSLDCASGSDTNLQGEPLELVCELPRSVSQLHSAQVGRVVSIALQMCALYSACLLSRLQPWSGQSWEQEAQAERREEEGPLHPRRGSRRGWLLLLLPSQPLLSGWLTASARYTHQRLLLIQLIGAGLLILLGCLMGPRRRECKVGKPRSLCLLGSWRPASCATRPDQQALWALAFQAGPGGTLPCSSHCRPIRPAYPLQKPAAADRSVQRSISLSVEIPHPSVRPRAEDQRA